MNLPRLVIAGTSSSVGKTSVSCGLILALKRSGYTVQPFKAGPDYIDPSHLSHVSGNPAVNLDVWLMRRSGVLDSFLEHSRSDISIIEGVMGYYDGVSGDSNYSSTHHIASILRSPVVLVIDAGRAARSVAATILGFKNFDKNSRIRGIVLNRLGSAKHEQLCRQALEQLGVPVIACIPRSDKLSLNSRHLGLVPATESKSVSDAIVRSAKIISDYVDTEALLRICKSARYLPKPVLKRKKRRRAIIGVALDGSFNFYYHENLESLRRQGAELKFFSPVSGSRLPRCDGLYIGGGFPEIQGRALAANNKIKSAVKKFAQDGAPVYAECGGLMYLTRSIRHAGKSHKMVGLFDADTQMTSKMILGYTKSSVLQDCLMFDIPGKFHGHEFHYSKLISVPADSKFAYGLSMGSGISDSHDGLLAYNTLASYGHLYFDSQNASKLVGSCAKFSKR